MKVIALLSWFDESPTWLTAAVASASRLCDAIVAVDGAYLLFPGRKIRSAPEQSEAILETALSLGMECVLHVPNQRWLGNEVEKRSHMLALGERIAEPWQDWYLVMDADDVLATVPKDARKRLEESEFNVAEVSLVETDDEHSHPAKENVARAFEASWDTTMPRRKMFRAIPGLTVQGAHWIYAYDRADGSRGYLRGQREFEPEDAEPLPDLIFEHRTRFRGRARRELQRTYYSRRNDNRIEKATRVIMEGTDGSLRVIGDDGGYQVVEELGPADG